MTERPECLHCYITDLIVEHVGGDDFALDEIAAALLLVIRDITAAAVHKGSDGEVWIKEMSRSWNEHAQTLRSSNFGTTSTH